MKPYAIFEVHLKGELISHTLSSLASNALALLALKVLGLGMGSGAIGAATNVPFACRSSSLTTGFFDWA